MSKETLQRETVRLQLLQIANDAAPYGLSEKTFRFHLQARHIPFDERLAAELAYLTGKGLLAAVDKTISPENAAFKITAEGMDFLATQGLE